jgi:hypothetical protein
MAKTWADGRLLLTHNDVAVAVAGENSACVFGGTGRDKISKHSRQAGSVCPWLE